jgi:uncharacterized protein
MRPLLPFCTALFVSLSLGCASTPSAPGAQTAATAGAKHGTLPWASFSLETFASAKTNRKFVLLDGTAEWCRPCRAMDETTYRHPEVRKLIDEHFVAIRVNIDENPDVQKLYADWGWPATVVFSPDAAELGKYQGYIGPEELVGILRKVVAEGPRDDASGGGPADPGILRTIPTPEPGEVRCLTPGGAP